MFAGTRFFLICIGLLVHCLNVSAYTKFKFIDRPARSNLSSKAMRLPFLLEKADYSFCDTHKSIKNYVFLDASDRKKIYKILASYDKKLIISSEMIQRYKATGRLNNNMIGLILQDFKVHHPDITVGQVLDALKKK